MTAHPIFLDLESAELPLSNIYLDPNNPRFVTPESRPVPQHRIDGEAVQEEARQKMVGEFETQKVRASIEVNGYLPLDHIVVREFKPGLYVVLEGNRRICAAKMISRYAEDGATVPDAVLQSLVKIPCLIYTGKERDAAWVLQGLRHLSGVLDWSPYNKARLFVEQMEKEGLSYAELGRKFGTSAISAWQWAHAYYAFRQAQGSSDYADVVGVAEFNYFMELFSNANGALRKWMRWDEKNLEFKDGVRFSEFLSWIYPKEARLDSGNGHRAFDGRPLPRAIDLRDVKDLIRDDPRTFDQFRRELDIDKARSTARSRRGRKKVKTKADPLAPVLDIIRACARVLKDNPYRLSTDEKSRAILRKELDALREALDSIPDDAGESETPIIRH